MIMIVLDWSNLAPLSQQSYCEHTSTSFIFTKMYSLVVFLVREYKNYLNISWISTIKKFSNNKRAEKMVYN